MNICALLQRATTVDEEVFDVCFEEIVTLVDQEKLNEAAALITDVLNDGSVDIRLVMYLFYSQFMTQGIGSLKEIIPATKSIITDFWEQISPVNMREKHFQTSVLWLLSAIGKKLKRSEKQLKNKKTDDFWNKSAESLNQEEIDQLILLTKELSQVLHQKIDEPSLNQYILFIVKWLENLKRAITVEKTAPPEKTSQPSPTPQKETSKKQISLDEFLNSSEMMIRLFKKIQAFEALIEKRNFEKAALISDDIALTIKNFDPTAFFPKLFSQYFALSAAHMDALTEQWENKGSLKWEALNRLYQTDIEEFIQW